MFGNAVHSHTIYTPLKCAYVFTNYAREGKHFFNATSMPSCTITAKYTKEKHALHNDINTLENVTPSGQNLGQKTSKSH